jgi:hypothetical protein
MAKMSIACRFINQFYLLLEIKVIKLTVIYNLLEGADHEAFVRWRTTEHQAENMAMPGVLKSDFYIIKEGWPNPETPYRYITEAYFSDMETFRHSFFEAEAQAKLLESSKGVATPLFLISEEVLTEVKAG